MTGSDPRHGKSPAHGGSWRRLVFNSGWSLAGQAAGLVAALVAIPVLLRNLGAESFGVFSIYLALVGYFGLLDLGIGRAVTTEVARHHSLNDRDAMLSSVATALALLAALGIVSAALIAAFRNPILLQLFPEGHRSPDARASLAALAVTIPIVVVTSGLRGALEGLQDFKTVGKITAPVGAMMFAAPAVVSMFSTALSDLMWSVFAVRVASMALFVTVCRRRFVGIGVRGIAWSRVRSLMQSGSWMTVSNVVSPLMTSVDRIVVGMQVSMSAVAQYVTPYEMATRVLLPAGSIGSAAFPEFVRQNAEDLPTSARRRHFLRVSGLACAAVLAPASLVFIAAHEILALWISESVAQQSSTILRVLLIGVVINGSTYIPFAFIQSLGRADVTAKFHVLEFFVYVPILLSSLAAFGVIGAAIAWVARVSIDAALMFGYALRRLR